MDFIGSIWGLKCSKTYTMGFQPFFDIDITWGLMN